MEIAFRILRSFCPPHLFEEIEGDLLQKFERDVKRVGEKKAKRKLIWNTIRFFRPGILIRRKRKPHTAMLLNLFHNLRFGTRHLVRQPVNSGIHIIGLALGISTCLVIALLLHFELTYDDYHNHTDRIYRISSSWPAQNFKIYATPIPLAEEIRHHTTGAEKVAMGLPQFNSTVWISPEKIFKQSKMIIAEPEFIDIFKFESVAGDLHASMAQPYTALLSQSAAIKFFGAENPIGKSFKLRSKFDITVGGVYRDLPANSNLPVSVILSYVENEEYLNNGDTWYFGHIPWTKLQAVTYILLEENHTPAAFQQQLDRVAEKNINSSPEIDRDVRGQLLLQPLSDIHLQKEYRGSGWVSAIAPSWLWFFGSIGVVVLALACINFLNLSTAQAVTRAREVGVRKVVGAGKFELINQFLCETVLLVGCAWLISIPIVTFSLPTINGLLGKSISLDPIMSLQFGFIAISSAIVISLLAGIYPAWFIARFKPADSLKGSSGYSSTAWLRKSLVVAQMGVSVILLVVVLVTLNQVKYVKNIDLGVISKNVLSLEIPDKRKGLALADQLKNLSSVKAVSLSRTQPVNDDHWWNGISTTKASQTTATCAIHADAHYYEVYGLKLISGSIPSQDKDTLRKVNLAVVNENLLKTLGLGTPEEAIGKRFQWAGDTEIAGVISDFNTEPLRYALSPTLIVQDSSEYTRACIRLEPTADIGTTTKAIESVWRKFFPNEFFNLQFMDEQMEGFYQTEERLSNVFEIFSVIAIIISCLGLWGLASFHTLQRKKEISIRKVLGATVANIMGLLTSQQVKLILIAGLVSGPISWYVVSQLFDSFAYKVGLTWWFFVAPVALLLFISLLTISALTIRAALINPAENLKGE